MCSGRPALKPDTVELLILGGTFEARQLAHAVFKASPNLAAVMSYAGIVSDLPDLPLPSRIGGFGGVEGLADYLRKKDVRLVVDATHPYAAQMSRNAALACEQTGTALIRLERASWLPSEEDNWSRVPSMDAACDQLEPQSRVFLAVGRKDLQPFLKRGDLLALARMIEPPDYSLPASWHLELARPAQSVEAELDLLQRHRITKLVCKNSGGTGAFAKLEAARRLKMQVIMVERPKLPQARSADTVDGLMKMIAAELRPS